MLRGLRSGFFHVDDLTAARDWYAGLLGYPPYFDESFYVGFDVEGYELGILPGGGAGGASHPAWAVDDPRAFVDRAVAMGATVDEEPTDVGEGIISAAVVDPFGNTLGVIFNPHFAPRLTHAAAEDISDRVIEVVGDVDIPPDEAWTLWSSSEGLARWWTENTRIDLRPGGSYEIHFDPEAAPGFRGADWCRVLSFLPGRMLSFTWNAPDTLATRPHHTFVVVLFEALATGSRVTLSHLGWPASGLADAESDWQATFDYFSAAWARVMARFVEHGS